MPRVSIGMPVFNGEAYLELALQSLLRQTFDDFELLISDNASTDRTSDICQDYASHDRRIRYERAPENLGAAGNYNRVFERSCGEFFKWAAHDDLCAPTYLERCLDTLDRAPSGVVLSYPKTAVIDADGTVLPWNDEDLDLRQLRPWDRLRQLLRNKCLSNPIFGVIRSAALRKTRLIGGFIASDYVTLAELSLLGQFWEIPDRLFYRRVHPGDSFQGKTAQAMAEWFDATNRGRATFPRGRVLVECLRSVARAPFNAADKIECLQIVLSELLVSRMQWRSIAGELRRAAPWRTRGR